MDLMEINETKMKIVIDNYFKSECNVDTSIRQAFEKGFRIGVQKGITLQPERNTGRWLYNRNEDGWKEWWTCDQCGKTFSHTGNFCSNCGAYMRGKWE